MHLGGAQGPWLNNIRDYVGQYVNADIRKVPFKSLALFGAWPQKVRGHEMAPLVVACVKSAYACDLVKYMKDDFLEFITTKDVKLDENCDSQMKRLDAAIEGLQYFNQDWKPALAALSRGKRIQQQSLYDVDIASAFMQKDPRLRRAPLN